MGDGDPAPHEPRDEPRNEPLYLPLGAGRYRAGRLTQGPWHPQRQHGGPVAALLAYAVEELAEDGWSVPQLTVDYLQPVPIGELTVDTRVVRRGRRSAYLLALLLHEGREVARARAWLVAPGAAPEAGERCRAPAPLPTESSYGRARFGFGFQEAVELRFVSGSFRDTGPATAWALLRAPVVPGVAPSPLQRTVAVADFATGISAEVSTREYSYANLDLSVHLHRQPVAGWICMSAATVIGATGSGLCATELHDERGPIGRCAQSLFVTPNTR